jgi:hypothetical protein
MEGLGCVVPGQMPQNVPPACKVLQGGHIAVDSANSTTGPVMDAAHVSTRHSCTDDAALLIEAACHHTLRLTGIPPAIMHRDCHDALIMAHARIPMCE